MFIEKPANKFSLARRKPLYGVGINDARYMTNKSTTNSSYRCPYYRIWSNMIERCYSEKRQLNNPTYKDCTVCAGWLYFSNFRAWMINQEWKDKELDKDLLSYGNKIYSPKFCIFIPHNINCLLLDNKKSRGDYPQGVYYYKRGGNYKSQCRVNGKTCHVGYFETPEEAGNAYIDYKVAYVISISDSFKHDERLFRALGNYVELLKKGKMQ